MSRKNLPYAGTTTETVEMTEIDGMEQGAILRYMDLGKPNEPCSVREIKTTMGDLYVIVNALAGLREPFGKRGFRLGAGRIPQGCL